MLLSGGGRVTATKMGMALYNQAAAEYMAHYYLCGYVGRWVELSQEAHRYVPNR